MRIGVVGNPGGWSSESLADAAARRTGERILIDMGRVWLDLAAGAAWCGDVNLCELDALIIKKLGEGYSPDHLDRLEILRFVHERGVPIFSQPLRIARVLDRLTCTVTLRSFGIPMPPTVICERVEDALAAVERYERAVFKPLFSSKARGMRIIEAGPSAAEQIADFQAAGNAIMYLQQMIDLPGRDLGVAFLGGEYLATYARVKKTGAWNSTTHSGGRYEPQDITPELIELARKAQEPFGLDFTCVDIAESAAGPMIFEVSAFGGFRGLHDAHGMDVGARLVDHVIGRL